MVFWVSPHLQRIKLSDVWLTAVCLRLMSSLDVLLECSCLHSLLITFPLFSKEYLQWFPILFSFPIVFSHWPDTPGHFLLLQKESFPKWQRKETENITTLLHELWIFSKCTANSLLFSHWSFCPPHPHQTLSVDRRQSHWLEALPWSIKKWHSPSGAKYCIYG